MKDNNNAVTGHVMDDDSGEIVVNSSLADKALEMALDCGAQQARATFSRSDENSVTALCGDIDRIMGSSCASMSVQLFVDGRYGSFSTNRMDTDALREFIGMGVAATKMVSRDKYRTLPDPSLYFKGGGFDLKQFDCRIKRVTPEERTENALKVNREILGRDNRLISVESEYGDLLDYSYIVDTNGFRGESLQSNFSISASCSIVGTSDEKPEAWWYDSALFLDRLKIDGCASTALQRALDSLGSKKIKSGKYNIVIENSVASKVVSPILTALTGSYLQQKNSFLDGSLGKKVFPSGLSIADRPHIPRTLGASWFDCDGIATLDADIIRDGVVCHYFLDTYNANKMGMKATAGSASCLEFSYESTKMPKKRKSAGSNANVLSEENSLPLIQVMNAVGKGILITGFNGGNCNTATGDFSYGIEGFLFEGGIKLHPVREMNVTGNMTELWNRLICIGNDPRECSLLRVPTLAFADVDISGID